jgi:hypothetical protein
MARCVSMREIALALIRAIDNSSISVGGRWMTARGFGVLAVTVIALVLLALSGSQIVHWLPTK